MIGIVRITMQLVVVNCKAGDYQSLLSLNIMDVIVTLVGTDVCGQIIDRPQISGMQYTDVEI